MRNWFSNLKFRYKLLIGMIAITTAALLLISQLSYSYFYKRNTREVLKKAEQSVETAGAVLSSQFQSLSAATNNLLVRKPFPDMIADIANNSFDGYSGYYQAASDEMASFFQNHAQVNNILICGENGFLFSPYSLGFGGSFETLFTENIWEYPLITVFPTRQNLLFRQGGAIPVSYPVSYSRGTGTFAYRDTEGKYKARVIILMDTGQIRSYFDQMSNGYTYCMYLADASGIPLDIQEETYPDAFGTSLEALVAQTDNLRGEHLAIDRDELVVSTAAIRFCDLKVVHISRKSALTGDIQEFRSFFFMVWLFCSAAAALLAFGLSHFLTRDIKTLGDIIAQINRRSYQTKVVFPRSDEISLLGKQLNQMYDTIQLQLLQIKEEEQKKARAEIQMMSEQINPHFLYNTLEYIHFQILNGHSDTAGSMLESLGRYLRITLSVGQTFISVEKEAEHVTSYMEIMNRHSREGVHFTCQIDSHLKNCKIMKVLLQPLAENCLKHGFGNMSPETWPVAPQITISITLDQTHTHMVIEVSDNGKGIDIPKATACLTEEQPEGRDHFGLNNIYRRLMACYGTEANISFVSIPYLKNSVIVTIPYDRNEFSNTH